MDRATLDVFAVSLVLPIAAMLFARLSPDPPAAPFTRSFEELGRAYRGTYIGLTLAALAPAAGVAFLVWRTFLASTEAGGFVAAADTISLRPGALAWLLSATILAMACARGEDDASRARRSPGRLTERPLSDFEDGLSAPLRSVAAFAPPAPPRRPSAGDSVAASR